MNRQPYKTPPKWWAPKLSAWSVRMTRGYRRRHLHRHQRLVAIERQGLHHVQQAVSAGYGVMIAANHSAHYDSAALYIAADQIRQPLYLLTAWQVFAMSNRLQRWIMQLMGCFSIDREGIDTQAFKQAIQVLRNEPHPLVIFPEGDIYHISDRVTPFREGAAAIALSAARRSDRPIVIIPCGIKFWYVDNPLDDLQRLMQQLEQRLFLKPCPGLSPEERISRLIEAMLTLKELEYLGQTTTGSIRRRGKLLSETILNRLESRHRPLRQHEAIPERVKVLRQLIIQELEIAQIESASDSHDALQQDLEDLFLVIQLYSYPGDYLSQQPSIERLAETLDKLEEDVLGRDLPSVRGRRRVSISFGEPISASYSDQRRSRSFELTQTIQQQVQALLDDLNASVAMS